MEIKLNIDITNVEHVKALNAFVLKIGGLLEATKDLSQSFSEAGTSIQHFSSLAQTLSEPEKTYLGEMRRVANEMRKETIDHSDSKSTDEALCHVSKTFSEAGTSIEKLEEKAEEKAEEKTADDHIDPKRLSELQTQAASILKEDREKRSQIVEKLKELGAGKIQHLKETHYEEFSLFLENLKGE